MKLYNYATLLYEIFCKLPYIGKNEIVNCHKTVKMDTANCHKSVKMEVANCHKSEKSGRGIAINPAGGGGYLLVASWGC